MCCAPAPTAFADTDRHLCGYASAAPSGPSFSVPAAAPVAAHVAALAEAMRSRMRRMSSSFREQLIVLCPDQCPLPHFPCYGVWAGVFAGNEPDPMHHWAELHQQTKASGSHRLP